jgi:hypothetical protein
VSSVIELENRQDGALRIADDVVRTLLSNTQTFAVRLFLVVLAALMSALMASCGNT